MKCDRCQFWGKSDGCCHKKAPVTVIETLLEEKAYLNSAGMTMGVEQLPKQSVRAAWPPTGSENFCGDFVQRLHR